MHRRHSSTTRIRAFAARDPRFVPDVPDSTGPGAPDHRRRRSDRAAAVARRILPAVLAALLVWAWAPPPAEAFHKYPKWKCGYHWTKGKWHRKQLIKCQAARKGLNGKKAVRVADCESNLNPGAVGGGGLYQGLYQQHKGYWPARARAAGFGGWSAFNGRANTFVSVQMAKSSGWTGHWPVCGYK